MYNEDMRLKAFRYYGSAAGVFLRGLPFSLIVAGSEVALRFWPKAIQNGIAITDTFPESRTKFVDTVTQALVLIESVDPLRFARLKREIRIIVNVPVPGGAEYSRFLKTCRINLRWFSEIGNKETQTTLLACRLIHQSTLGHLCSRKVWRHGHFERVVKLCYQEEARFAKRLGLDLGPDWGLFGQIPTPLSDKARKKWAQQETKRMLGSHD